MLFYKYARVCIVCMCVYVNVCFERVFVWSRLKLPMKMKSRSIGHDSLMVCRWIRSVQSSVYKLHNAALKTPSRSQIKISTLIPQQTVLFRTNGLNNHYFEVTKWKYIPQRLHKSNFRTVLLPGDFPKNIRVWIEALKQISANSLLSYNCACWPIIKTLRDYWWA